MLGVRVSVPIACFRKGYAREYCETEVLPPPATAYGFLLSFIGETNRHRHVNARVTVSLVDPPPELAVTHTPSISAVLRKMWRIKNKKQAPGAGSNACPNYQQLLSQVDLVVWLDSDNEERAETLEARVETALNQPHTITRFGALSLGESTHMVDTVDRFDPKRDATIIGRTFELRETGRLTLPVWVDHVGSSKTRYAVGDLVEAHPLEAPRRETIPAITPV